MRGSGEWKGTLTLFVRTWAYGQPLNLDDKPRASPGSGRHFARRQGHCAHLGVMRLSGALGVITCWANTRLEGRAHSYVMHSAHITSEPRKLAGAWLELMGANLEVGRKVGAVRHFRSRAWRPVSAALMKAPLFRK